MGCFERTIEAPREAGRLSLPIQVNTLVAEETADDLPAIHELLKTFPVMRWSLLFLVSVGRGKALQEVSPERGEEIMNWVLDLAPHAPFAVKTTEAPSYRRLALNKMHAAGISAADVKSSSVYKGFQIRDGHGIVFVSVKEIFIPPVFCPSPAATCGPVPWLTCIAARPCSGRFIRPSSFGGKCGACEFSHICGGSRARAYAYTGDALESDPFCSYVPTRLSPAVAGANVKDAQGQMWHSRHRLHSGDKSQNRLAILHSEEGNFQADS